MTIDLTIPPDDLSLTIPAEQSEYTDWYSVDNLVDEGGNQLVDESGNLLIAPRVTTANVLVLHVPPDDLSITVREET